MKIAYFAFSENHGGKDAGFVHTESIVSALRKSGTDITLFIGAPETLKNRGNTKGTVFVTLPRLKSILWTNPLSYVKSFLAIRKKIAEADIIHERFHVNPVDLLFIGKKKYILEVNDPAIELSGRTRRVLYRWLVRMKYNRADAIIVQTETLGKIVSRHTKTPVYIIPNGVDTKLFGPRKTKDTRKRYSIEKEDTLITFVGSFREWHGVSDVLEMAKRMPDAKFLLVGTGRLFDSVREASAGTENIILAGAVSYTDIPSIMESSDILIAPFSTKGFMELEKHGFWWCPVKIFEYMASGKPVVSYDYPEVKKIVGKGGLLAKQGDLDGFIDLLERLKSNSALRKELGLAARKIAEHGYSWETRAKELKAVYRKVLAKKQEI